MTSIHAAILHTHCWHFQTVVINLVIACRWEVCIIVLIRRLRVDPLISLRAVVTPFKEPRVRRLRWLTVQRHCGTTQYCHIVTMCHTYYTQTQTDSDIQTDTHRDRQTQSMTTADVDSSDHSDDMISDVTIIESEIEIEFFLENRIESKSIFWLVFVIDFDSRLYWRRLQRVQRMTVKAAESWIRWLNYKNRARYSCFNGRRVATPPTPVSMTQFLLSPWTIVPLSRVAMSTAYSPTSWSEITAQR